MFLKYLCNPKFLVSRNTAISTSPPAILQYLCLPEFVSITTWLQLESQCILLQLILVADPLSQHPESCFSVDRMLGNSFPKLFLAILALVSVNQCLCWLHLLHYVRAKCQKKMGMMLRAYSHLFKCFMDGMFSFPQHLTCSPFIAFPWEILE